MNSWLLLPHCVTSKKSFEWNGASLTQTVCVLLDWTFCVTRGTTCYPLQSGEGCFLLCSMWVISPAIGLIRLVWLSVFPRDNSRTKRARQFKFGANGLYTNSVLVSEDRMNRVTMRPAGLLISVNCTCFESVAYKYRSCFVVVWNC
jgi:hypothetical protein